MTKECKNCFHYKKKSCPVNGLLFRKGEGPNLEECFQIAPDGLSDVPTVEEGKMTEARNLRGMNDDPKARVIVEKEGLEIKIDKLKQFLESGAPEDNGLSKRMIQAMKDQLISMMAYHHALEYRLLIWGKSDEEIEEEWHKAVRNLK